MSEHREYCHNCGARISAPSAFCGSCGAALAQPASESARDLAAAAPPAPATATATSAEAPPARGAATSTPAEASAGAAPAGGAAASTATRPAANAPGSAPPGMAPAPGPPPAPDDGGEQQRRWLPFAAVGGAELLAVAVAVALLLALGGSAGSDVKNAAATRQQALALLAANGTTTVSRAAPGLFAIVSAGNLTLAVPAGWHATSQSAGTTTRAEFADPSHGSSSLTVVAERASSGNAHTRATAARKAAAAKGDSVASLSAVTFPGGRQAWRLAYSAANLTHDTYFTGACNGAIAIVVDAAAPAALIASQQASLEQAAASAEPKC